MKNLKVIVLPIAMSVLFLFTRYVHQRADSNQTVSILWPHPDVKKASHQKGFPGRDLSSQTELTKKAQKIVEGKPWDRYPPLTEDEKRVFRPAEAQIRQFLMWGASDAGSIDEFRKILFLLGDKAVADIGRSLFYVNETVVQNKRDSDNLIEKIDMLGYFCISNFPLAHSVLESLATRDVTWNSQNNLENPLQAAITFEAFDLYAKYHPDRALELITKVRKQWRTAYFTHYAYGRRLVGKTMNDIDQELRNVFGSPELATK